MPVCGKALKCVPEVDDDNDGDVVGGGSFAVADADGCTFDCVCCTSGDRQRLSAWLFCFEIERLALID